VPARFFFSSAISAPGTATRGSYPALHRIISSSSGMRSLLPVVLLAQLRRLFKAVGSPDGLYLRLRSIDAGDMQNPPWPDERAHVVSARGIHLSHRFSPRGQGIARLPRVCSDTPEPVHILPSGSGPFPVSNP
jgi:hypothetical protein